MNLGVEQLSTHDVLNSYELEKKYRLVNQAIHFHGPCDTTESCTIKKKIDELKDKIAEYYFDPQSRVIAIPNQILDDTVFHKKIFDQKQTDKKRQIKISIENDKYYEDLLHLTIINTLQKLDSDGFVMEGFHSGACLQAKLKLGKQLRKDSQCNCKANEECECGKPKYPELNVHEREIMLILEVNEMRDDEFLR